MARATIILLSLCAILFLVQLLVPGFTELFLLNAQSFIQPWRFISAIFLHGGIAHLAYNLFALFFFGLVLESVVGTRRFLLVFFISGLIANVLSVFFYNASLGASGAIFGVIGCLIVLRPSMTVWAYGLPMPLFVAGIAWGIGDAIGAFTPSSGIANLAHLSGMGAGLILGAALRDWRTASIKSRFNRVSLDELYVRKWEDAYLR
jgi:membrane associated rhomboid family serine protease